MAKPCKNDDSVLAMWTNLTKRILNEANTNAQLHLDKQIQCSFIQAVTYLAHSHRKHLALCWAATTNKQCTVLTYTGARLSETQHSEAKPMWPEQFNSISIKLKKKTSFHLAWSAAQPIYIELGRKENTYRFSMTCSLATRSAMHTLLSYRVTLHWVTSMVHGSCTSELPTNTGLANIHSTISTKKLSHMAFF